MKSTLDRVLPAISGASLIGAWYLARFTLGDEQKFLLPPPHDVLLAFRDNGPAIWQAASNTAAGALFGFGAAVVLSFLLALILSLSPRVRTSFYPYLMVLQMTPIVVLAPILILWVGPGIKSVVIITFLICFFPMVVNTTQGLISTDRNLVDFFRMCQATRRQEILLLRVPAALPYFFTGLRIAGTLAPIGGGLGYLTIVFSSQFKMAALFATAVSSCAMGFVFVGAVLTASWWALHRWHDSYSKADT